MDKIHETVVFENGSGEMITLSDPAVSNCWELRGRSGFSAPEIDVITQKYANGVTKVLKRILMPRTVTLNMIVIGKNKAQRDALFYDMTSRLLDAANGDSIGKLIIRRSDGIIVYLNCVYSSGLKITEEYQKFHRFTLEFYAADPYFYSDLEDVEIQLGSDAKITLRDRLLLGTGHVLGEITGEGHGIVRNNSYESILPVIRAKRINGTIRITNETTGQVLALNNIVTEYDQELVIDTRGNTKSIKIVNPDGTWISAGQYLDWSNINMDFEIIQGENEITFSAGVGSYTEGIVLEMSQRFLSA